MFSWGHRKRNKSATRRKGQAPYDRAQSIRDFLIRFEEEYLTEDQYRDVDRDFFAGKLDFHAIKVA